jgi:probable phosphoglycerate mutase
MGVLLSLARHGETADNAQRIFQGQSGRGLNRLGRAQAERLAERMRRNPPLAIIASDLERAVETAKIVSKACGVAVELEMDLREVDVGAWTGKSYDEVAAAYPEEWAAWEAGLDIRRGGGETYAELAVRVGRGIDRIATRFEGARGRILVVSHGGAIKSWIAKLLGVSPDGLRALAGVANAALTVVERDSRGRHRLHSWNDSAHLEGLVVDEHSD